MSNVVLVRGADRALYINGELVGTWDKHDLLKHVEAQIESRCGEDGFVERDHEGEWPETVADEQPAEDTGKKAKAKKEPAPLQEPDQAEMDWVDE